MCMLCVYDCYCHHIHTYTLHTLSLQFPGITEAEAELKRAMMEMTKIGKERNPLQLQRDQASRDRKWKVRTALNKSIAPLENQWSLQYKFRHSLLPLFSLYSRAASVAHADPRSHPAAGIMHCNYDALVSMSKTKALLTHASCRHC